MPDITGDKSAPVKKQFNPRPQESAKAMISVVFVGYRSPFYNGVNVAERQVIVVALFTCTPINSAPPAVIAK